MRNYLLNSVARFDKPDEGATPVDEAAARKAHTEAERAKVVVTKVDIEEEKEEEEIKDEQKDEGGEEEKEDKSEEKEDVDEVEEDKEELRARQKQERINKKFEKKDIENRALRKKVADLEAKLAANPDKVLTEEDVETLSEQKAIQKQLIKELNQASDRLADEVQKHLKMKDKEFNKLVAGALEELDITGIPGEIVGALGDIDNGGVVLAHLLKNVEEMEEYIHLRNRPVKLGLELAKLSSKLAAPIRKKISQVPDAVEPIGGKSGTSDRLSLLMGKKNKSQEEMNEYVQLRNSQVQQARMNGRHNLR